MRGRCRKNVPVLGGDGTKIAPTVDIFDKPSGEMSSVWAKIVEYAGNLVPER